MKKTLLGRAEQQWEFINSTIGRDNNLYYEIQSTHTTTTASASPLWQARLP